MDEVPTVEIYEHKGLAYMAVSGTASDVNKAVEAVKNAVNKIKENGIDKRSFIRIRKKITGDFMRSVDGCETAVMMQAEFRDRSLAEIAETVRNMSHGEFCNILVAIGTDTGVCVVKGK